MAAVDDPNILLIDEAYEFAAPQFYDFVNGETEENMRKAELWFGIDHSYAPSPFMSRIKTGRTVQLETLCDFGGGEQMHKESETIESISTSYIIKESSQEPQKKTSLKPGGVHAEISTEITTNEAKEEHSTSLPNVVCTDTTREDVKGVSTLETESVLTKDSSPLTIKVESPTAKNAVSTAKEACTPAPTNKPHNGENKQTDSKKHQTAKKIASMTKNHSGFKSKSRSQLSQAKNIRPASASRDIHVKAAAGTPNFAQENQAIKRQKLDGGKSRPILSLKPQNLPHKMRSGESANSSSLCSSTAKTRKEDRKIYVREPAAPFVSMAEMMKKFQSNTREMSLPHADVASVMKRKPKLTLTQPKEPEFETAQRVRSVRVKSSAELEEEMMAKIPKFKARPLNKKILEVPKLPALPRSTPQLPEFQEFHLATMERANKNAESSTVASTDSTSHQIHQWEPRLTAPKSPLLHTSLRSRPPRIKSSVELENEELEKIPKFKARPLNKKILESKGDLGICCNAKRQVTVPQEFHFAVDERIPPPATVVDLFDKLSLNSEPHHDKQIHRNTKPNPFHLHTEERGAEKERKFMMELMQKQLEDEKARIPKASPYPYTTDYPVIPPKPEPKQCTQPEPFELESLVRHEEEMQREMEERRRMEMEEAHMRIFKAQPISKDDPIPVPEKVRKPLTEVQEFNLHVDHRAIDRAQFDNKVKEKEMIYKRYREEAESEKMMEEEKALKQLRRTLVPHAKPVPNFNHPFLPQKSSKEVTKPKSPKLRVVGRKEARRKMVCTMTATSSSASYMR